MRIRLHDNAVPKHFIAREGKRECKAENACVQPGNNKKDVYK